MALGAPGPPLEASWAPLGARMRKTIEKVTRRTPPPGEPKGGHFGALFDTFSVTVFGTSFGIIFSYLLDPLGPEKVAIFIRGLFNKSTLALSEKVTHNELKNDSMLVPFGS